MKFIEKNFDNKRFLCKIVTIAECHCIEFHTYPSSHFNDFYVDALSKEILEKVFKVPMEMKESLVCEDDGLLDDNDVLYINIPKSVQKTDEEMLEEIEEIINGKKVEIDQ